MQNYQERDEEALNGGLARLRIWGAGMFLLVPHTILCYKGGQRSRAACAAGSGARSPDAKGSTFSFRRGRLICDDSVKEESSVDEQSAKDVKIWTGHRDITLEELAIIQPGMGTIMPEIGQRAWKLFYAAKAGNWVLANFQLKEVRELMEKAAFIRPKYEQNLEQFLSEKWTPLEEAIKKENFALFEERFQESITAANSYHELQDKGFIVWKLPANPPPDLDLNPKPGA